MLYRAFLITLLATMPLFTLAQKAYETVSYSGKIKGKTITLKLANGYIGASELSLSTSAPKATIAFKPESGVPDENNQLVFKSPKAANGFFLIKNMQEAYDQPPAAIYGVYNLGAQTLPVKLLLDNTKI